MKENIFAIILVLLFTLVYSCSDNKRQKRMDKGFLRSSERIQTVHAKISIHQDNLEKSLLSIIDGHLAVFGHHQVETSRRHDVLVQNQTNLVDNHRKLLDQVDVLKEYISYLVQRNHQEMYVPKENDLIKIQVQMVDLMKRSNRIMNRQKNMLGKHQKYLKG